MLLRLMPDKISEYWEMIKLALHETLPPVVEESPEKLNRIFEALLEGDMHCWVSAHEDDGHAIFEGIIVTGVLNDSYSMTKSLLIYTVYMFTKNSTGMSWDEGIEKLLLFAKGLGCYRVIAYTQNELIANFIERAGGDVSWKFLSLPVSQIGTKEE